MASLRAGQTTDYPPAPERGRAAGRPTADPILPAGGPHNGMEYTGRVPLRVSGQQGVTRKTEAANRVPWCSHAPASSDRNRVRSTARVARRHFGPAPPSLCQPNRPAIYGLSWPRADSALARPDTRHTQDRRESNPCQVVCVADAGTQQTEVHSELSQEAR